ncbi:MAG TPA: hypothetical protein GXX75_00870 [Clostridiales bacterium]|nr:hypothetical protein [Clostridiales bacterium]
MLHIKEVAFTLALEDRILDLDYVGCIQNGDHEVHAFIHKDRKIEALLDLTSEEGITIGTVKVQLDTHPFRESYNMRGQSPIRLAVTFDEIPSGYCAQYQHRDWWSRPAFVTSPEQLPERTQSLFVKGKTGYGYILPMLGDKTKTYISTGTKTQIVFEMTAYTEGINQVRDCCFLLTEGKDLYDCSRRVFQKACELKNIPMKSERSYPEMFEYFGWCSWDAFYQDITEDKVLEKVEEIKSKQIPVRWIILDDGWLSGKDQCLASFRPDPEKFQNGFKELTAKIKKETDISRIGVWHALGGYWGGIAEDSQLAIQNKDNLYKTKNGKLIPHYNPEKGYGFWRDWYSYLKEQGIDFVKVDGQSALKNYYRNNEEIAKVAAGTHKGIEKALMMLMNGNIINCMGMAIENILSRPVTCISRNSDDFVPDAEQGFQEHMLQNAYNGLYHDNVYVCDWDMYWTKHPDAAKHALVRAISGGPVYVSDRVGETEPEEIKPLTYHDGRILRMDRCAKPTTDCIFASPLERQALKLSNTVNGTGAIAAFHISNSKEAIHTTLSPSDIYDLAGEEFGAYNYFEGTFTRMGREDKLPLCLQEKEYALVLFLPLQKSVTPIGLVDKYMSAHAVQAIHETGCGTEIVLREGGLFAFYKREAPELIFLKTGNLTEKEERAEKKEGYYLVDLSEYKEELTITIR